MADEAEDANETVRARIDGLCREYKPKKYQVAVYKSGREDLHTSVLDLLAYNKRRAAELQVQREKAAKAERRRAGGKDRSPPVRKPTGGRFGCVTLPLSARS